MFMDKIFAVQKYNDRKNRKNRKKKEKNKMRHTIIFNNKDK